MMGGWLVAVLYGISCKTINNCPSSATNLSTGFASIAHTLIIIIGMLAVIFVIVGGLQITLSAGDAKRYQQGRDSLQYAIAGVILAIMAYAIVDGIAAALGK